jgi:aryl-alcohol dehydrogenase-like predicted oxidoreductase
LRHITSGPGLQVFGQALVDTAIIYQEGQTEEAIGQILRANHEQQKGL